MSAEYDYVVVGGGTAGCVLAARLTEDPAIRVLLIEAGSAAPSRVLTVPNAWPENLGTGAEWGDRTVPQAGAGAVSYPLGRVLGGSGAINALAHVRGHRLVYDGWAIGGAPGWAFDDLLPFFRRSERAVGRDPVLRGTAGPVRVAPVPEAERHPVAAAFAAAVAAAGCPVTGDLSGRVQEGIAWVDLAVAGGERCGPVQAYLRSALRRASLEVRTGCLVTGLMIERGRCTGVSFVQVGGVMEQARVSREVLLCSGAVGSAQLLMLSGIGPAATLRKAGVEPVADLPVGENLQDHPIVLASYSVPAPLPPSGFNHGEVYAAVRSRLAGPWPDVHVFPILLPLAPAGLEPPAAGFALAAAVVAPASRGTVRLASANPGDRPLIDPAFLREPGDATRLAEALGLVRDAAAGLARAGLAAAEVWPGRDVRDPASVQGYIRRAVGSYYHPAGTCPMGTGPNAVVDPQLRVRGIEGLRVADASVMPVLPNAHPNATVLAIAERAAALITDG